MKLLIFCLIFCSCSRLEFAAQTTESLPIFWGPKAGHDIFTRVEGTVPLYLWGAVDSPLPVSLEQEFSKAGAISVSKLSVYEISGWDVWWPRLLSFGMYWPIKWQAEAFVQKPKNQER